MSTKSRVKKIRIVDVVPEATTYEDVIKEVSEPAKEEPLQTAEAEPNEKKERQLVVCDGCGKSMTSKNLKYSHKKSCPANAPKTALMEVELEDDEMPPPPPKLKRQQSRMEHQPIPEEPVVMKKTRNKKQVVESVPIRALAERFAALAAQALP